jgi:hypothetical protein
MKKLIKEHYDSINLFEKLSILNESEIASISTGLDWTTINEPSAVLIGGTALIHYLSKSRDLTPDIDYMVDEISKVKAKLENDDILFKSLRAGNIGLLGITVDEFNTDYLDSNVGNVLLNKLILKDYIYAKISNYDIRIITPELLAIMKIELGRDKDVNDGFALIQSGKLDKTKYLKYLNYLKNSLKDYESLLSYSEML